MQPLSIYIHFPYCELKCPYCDFNSHVAKDFKEKELVECYLREIDFFLQKMGPSKNLLKSVFFGGGTPSLMQPESVFQVLEYIKNHELIEWKNVEVTLEANPSSAEYSKFEKFKKAGVNRLSLGVQSLNPQDLKFLGRKHGVEEAKQALLMAKEIFNEFSFDLIYCLPGQTLKIWEKELSFALENYAKNHISAYTLTIEKGTPFFKQHLERQFILPKNEDEFYFLTNSILESYDFKSYEISNYAKPGKECLHNLSYWQSVDYLGIGPGAHGRITTGRERFATQNYANPEKYIESVAKNGNAMQVFAKLLQDEIIKETLIMNLRVVQGINLLEFKAKYGFDILDFLNKKHLNSLEENGLLECSPQSLKLTKAGIPLLNSIILKLS